MSTRWNKDVRPRAKSRSGQRGRGSSRPVWLWIAGAVAVVAAFIYFGPFRSQPTSPSYASADDQRITLIAGQTAPDFTLPSTDGPPIHLAELRAKTNVLLYFQEGIMCPPCWQQMRELKRDAAKLQALNTTLVTITVDPLDQLNANVAREQVDGLTLLFDKDAAVSRTYQALYVSMHPGQRPGHTFVLVGTDGKILWRRDFQEMYVPDPTILDPVAKALGR